MKSREEVTSFQLTLYTAHSEVSRGNLVLREFGILHCVLSGRNQRRALPQQQSEIEILNILFPRVRIELTTCHII